MARKLGWLALAAVVGAALYATAAPASQQAGPTRGEFNALKARVAKVERNTNAALALLGGCLQRGVPVSRYSGYVSLDPNGNPFQTTALDITDQQGVTPQTFLLDIGPECANAIANTLKTKLTVVHLHVTPKLQR